MITVTHYMYEFIVHTQHWKWFSTTFHHVLCAFSRSSCSWLCEQWYKFWIPFN